MSLNRFKYLIAKLKLIVRIIRTPPNELFPKYRTTIDNNTEWDEDPLLDFNKKIRFFRLKDNLGIFEIKNITRKVGKPEPFLTIYNSVDDTEFVMSRKWFNYMFEPVSISPKHKENVSGQ